MNLLLTGPPGSGKSSAALQRFREIPGSLLLTPTATMAEHVRNNLARSGMAVRPSSVQTLAQFLDSCPIPAGVPEPLLLRLIKLRLDGLDGFEKEVAKLFEAAPIAPEGELGRLYREVARDLDARGFAFRAARLRAAAEVLPPLPHVVVDGFFTLSPREVHLLNALAERSVLTLALPGPVNGLKLDLFQVRRLTAIHRSPRRTVFTAATPEREAEEIARRILEHASGGGLFRDIGIVLRSRDPYGPLQETTLDRFGIPFRSYFADSVADHPAVAYLSGVVRALLGGWDLTELGALARMPVSGLGTTPRGDELDFAWRERLPARGLPGELAHLEFMTLWGSQRHAPVEWARIIRPGLRLLLPAPAIFDRASWEQVQAWRSTAVALAAFEKALDASASALGATGAIALRDFWTQMETTLACETLRVPDARRDVVHVMDVFEARQWELPIVFVCGLVERQFPQYHRQDALIGDAARHRLGLSTAAERQEQERFLFDLAATRATREVVLSYPSFDEKGEDTLPSFFLEGAEPKAVATRVRPRPLREVLPRTPAPLSDTVLLAGRHKSLSPSAIESFLQCPFQFFAGKTMRLRERPPAPRDRLDVRMQGSILHAALAEWAKAPLLGASILTRVFDDECDKRRVPATYRREAVRLELSRHFERFLADHQAEPGGRTRTEEKFNFTLGEGLEIRGRIDRIDVGTDRQALVIDYKYSAGNRIRDLARQSEAGTLVQGGLYLVAAERALGLVPAGMLYCGLKKKVSWEGWHVPIAGLERVGESRTPEALRELMDQAAQKALEVHQSIVSGRVDAHPADSDKCRWCDFRDICRVETLPAIRGMGAS